MASETETVADIVREVREHGRHAGTFEWRKMFRVLCDRLEAAHKREVAKIEQDHKTVMGILRDVKLYPHSLCPDDDDFDRPSGDEMDASYRAVCKIRIMFPQKGGNDGR